MPVRSSWTAMLLFIRGQWTPMAGGKKRTVSGPIWTIVNYAAGPLLVIIRYGLIWISAMVYSFTSGLAVRTEATTSRMALLDSPANSLSQIREACVAFGMMRWTLLVDNFVISA